MIIWIGSRFNEIWIFSLVWNALMLIWIRSRFNSNLDFFHSVEILRCWSESDPDLPWFETTAPDPKYVKQIWAGLSRIAASNLGLRQITWDKFVKLQALEFVWHGCFKTQNGWFPDQVVWCAPQDIHTCKNPHVFGHMAPTPPQKQLNHLKTRTEQWFQEGPIENDNRNESLGLKPHLCLHFCRASILWAYACRL